MNYFKDFLSKPVNQAIVSFLIVVAVFFGGYYFGKGDSSDPLVSSGAESPSDANLESFWKVWEILGDKFAPASSTSPAITSEDKIWGAISGLAASYKDPYTVFFPPVESKIFEEEISGSFSGIGMEIDIRNGVLTVVSPLKGTPAYRAGVKPGDKVIKIDDTIASSLPVGEAVKLIRGESGTSVTITFQRDGESAPLVKKITREAIEIPAIETKKLDGGIFVISLYNFSAISPNSFRASLREFVESGSDKLILDLRNNPGGYLEAALDMASWFLPAGKVVVTEDFGEKKEDLVYKSKGYDIFNDNLKFVILVDRGSASASEILAGALREHGKAILIGENTFGKGSVQELVDITDKTSLKVTVAHWLTPEGHSISNGGLTPDIKVEVNAENTKNGNDPALNRAIEYLKTGK